MALEQWFKNDMIGPPECPMMRRWAFLTPLGSIRLHHFLRGDLERDPHNHPWWFITLVLSGGYTDTTRTLAYLETPEYSEDVLTRGSLRIRPAGHTHWVRRVLPGTWTLVVTGRNKHTWGFMDGLIFEPAARYFTKYGYQPCPADDTSFAA